MKHLLKHVWLVAIIGVFVASCGKSTEDLTNAIPKDALYVIHLNTESLVKKSEWNIFKNEKIAKQIEQQKGRMDEKASKLFDAFVKNPNSFGLDLVGDAYMYIGPSTSGISMRINDSDKFKETLLAFETLDAESIQEKDGVLVCKLDRRNAVAWNKNTFLFVSTDFNREFRSSTTQNSSTTEDDIDVIALKQLNQTTEASINSVSGFSEFEKEQKDISVFYAYNSAYLDAMLSNMPMLPNFPKEVVEEMKSFDGVASCAYISFDKGEISMISKSYFANSDSEKKFKELTESMMATAKGEQLKYLQGNPLLAINTSLKGDGVKSYLQKMGIWKFLRTSIGDNTQIVENVIANLHGDVSFAFSNIVQTEAQYEGWDGQMKTYKRQIPELAFFADCKDGKAIMDMMNGLIPEGMEDMNPDFKRINNNVFSFNIDGSLAYCGVKDNMFFCTNIKSVYENIESGVKKDNIVSELSKGNYMTVAGDLEMLKGIVSSFDSGFIPSSVYDFIGLFNTYQLQNKDGMTGSGKIEMKDTNKNSLAQICQFIDKLITEMM